VTAEYVPTDAQRALVESAAAFGLTQADAIFRTSPSRCQRTFVTPKFMILLYRPTGWPRSRHGRGSAPGLGRHERYAGLPGSGLARPVQVPRRHVLRRAAGHMVEPDLPRNREEAWCQGEARRVHRFPHRPRADGLWRADLRRCTQHARLRARPRLVGQRDYLAGGRHVEVRCLRSGAVSRRACPAPR
jgi:hypothetical protein